MTYLEPKGEGDNSMPATSGRVQADGTGCWETRVIWRKLDCLNPNLQLMQRIIRRKDA